MKRRQLAALWPATGDGLSLPLVAAAGTPPPTYVIQTPGGANS